MITNEVLQLFVDFKHKFNVATLKYIDIYYSYVVIGRIAPCSIDNLMSDFVQFRNLFINTYHIIRTLDILLKKNINLEIEQLRSLPKDPISLDPIRLYNEETEKLLARHNCHYNQLKYLDNKIRAREYIDTGFLLIYLVNFLVVATVHIETMEQYLKFLNNSHFNFMNLVANTKKANYLKTPSKALSSPAIKPC